MEKFFLDKVMFESYSDGNHIVVSTNLPSTGCAWVKFDKPITDISEIDLINMLSVCRKARRAYKAANGIK